MTFHLGFDPFVQGMTLLLGFDRTGKRYEIQPNELNTHACMVGMTGSGKTGLAISLLEVAALARIPIIAIDPKGDLGNMMLALDDAKDYRVFIDEGAAERQGLTPEELALKTEIEWKRGREADGCTPDILREYRDELAFRVYCPGGGPGLQLSVVSALSMPDERVDMVQHVSTVAQSILAMARKKPLPGDVALMAQCILHRWRMGEDVQMAMLVQDIMDPPFPRMGAIDVETFYPRARRHKLAMDLNAMIASPTWDAWTVGDPLDIERILVTDGKPIVNIINIAHLPDHQRHFFVALLLNQCVAWMRTQRGTSSLRALFYMDEVAGYFPPTANPPAKGPMLTLLKQARAFGFGMVLSTQNPADIDYKMLSNMGMWCIGKLTTERDKRRLMDGLLSSDSPMDAGEIGKQIAGLGKREFLMHSVYRPQTVIRSRHCISWLKGPLSHQELSMLSGPVVQSIQAEILQTNLRNVEVAIAEQRRVVSALTGELHGGMWLNLLKATVMAIFGGRFGKMSAMRTMVPKVNHRKAQSLMEAQSRLRALENQRKQIRDAMMEVQ